MSPLTGTGVRRFVVLPSPSWPLSFNPHAQTVPSLFRARLCAPPAAIAVNPTPATPLTVTVSPPDQPDCTEVCVAQRAIAFTV